MNLLKLGKIYNYFGQLEEAREFVAKAEEIIRSSYGTSHIMYKGELEPLLTQVGLVVDVATKYSVLHCTYTLNLILECD